jgi:zinc-ribbon domain
VTCPRCGLALPARARFCARCGTQLALDARPRAAAAVAPVWLLALLWIGAAALVWVTAVYLAIALALVPAEALGASAADLRGARGPAAVISLCAASLAVAHVVAALGLMGGRPWARPFATMVCVVWALTCVGLPVGLLGINALWRPRRAAL